MKNCSPYYPFPADGVPMITPDVDVHNSIHELYEDTSTAALWLHEEVQEKNAQIMRQEEALLDIRNRCLSYITDNNLTPETINYFHIISDLVSEVLDQ